MPASHCGIMRGMTLFRLFAFMSLLIGVGWPAWVCAEEPTTIQQILDQPQVFHLRHVTLQGTVRDVQPLDPYTLPNGTNCYGAYLFRLEDDSSSLSVAVLGICGKPLVRD